MQPKLDHLVVAAGELGEGTAWIQEGLGQPPGGGGRHEGMGTHNALWRLGSAYLEVIAIDPDAAEPERPRWFGLDHPEMRKRLTAGPVLATWAVAVEAFTGPAAHAPVSLAPAEWCAREDLRWQVMRAEGVALPLGGAWPLLIRWGDAPHPAGCLPDAGLRLASFTLGGPHAPQVSAALGPVAAPVTIGIDPSAPVLSATVTLASGRTVPL